MHVPAPRRTRNQISNERDPDARETAFFVAHNKLSTASQWGIEIPESTSGRLLLPEKNMRHVPCANHVAAVLAAVSLLSASLAMASVNASLSPAHAAAALVPAGATPLQGAVAFTAPPSPAVSEPARFQTALVNSCSDSWWWRSGIEELACGLSGQGWWN
ncbi:hypothetical protein [Burkholderia gladioli]|uniref:hypothetical protein n=1 Tax=Burkholderia gladioli TaxID=28095 RepID=UPI00163F7F73|nr:hypothetical protein [Burkholderia gladioli]MDN7808715.1 hypothetical protein [Burkholderia gladioli]